MVESLKEKVLRITLEELDLSVRSYNCLKRAGINTVKDLSEKTYEDMLEVRNLGKKSLEEVIQKLASLGLALKESEPKGYKCFRDVYHKLAIVLDNGYCFDTFQMMAESSKQKVVPDGIQVNSALVYGYIDKMCGFSYKVLGLTYYEDGDYTLVWPNDEVGLTVRGECFKVFELIPIENKALLKRYAREIQITNEGYSNENDEQLRAITYLDKFRHYDCPDDILAILYVQGLKPEKIWVRPTQYIGDKENRHYFLSTLLNEPFSDYGVHYKDQVVLVIDNQNGEDMAICFPGSK